MTSEAEKWLSENPGTSSDYAELVRRMKAGESVECVIEFDGNSHLSSVEYKKQQWGGLFNIVINDGGKFHFSAEYSFIEHCESLNLLFSVAEQDFLKRTKKMLEIAKDAEFKAITVPLNTLADVEKMLELMDRAEVSNGSL